MEEVSVPAKEVMYTSWPKVEFADDIGAAVHAGDGGEEAAVLFLVWGGPTEDVGVHGGVVAFHVKCLQNNVRDKIADMPGKPVGGVHIFIVAADEEGYTGEVKEVVGA